LAIDDWLLAIGYLIRTANKERDHSMAKYQKFEDLPVWQEGARLYNRVLDLLEEPNVPLTPGFRNQLDRAALSVSNNVAEGFERVTTNELNAFLAIARVCRRGSLDDGRGEGPAEAQAPYAAIAGNPFPGRIVRPAAHRLDGLHREFARARQAAPDR
jgi:hypothetical protein